MELTEEQRERIRKNRERALAIQQQRKQEKQKLEHENNEKKRIIDETTTTDETTRRNINKKQKTSEKNDDATKNSISISIPMEDWEVGLGEWVSKKEASKMYCLPEGTLVVCEVQEKENPHNKGWKPMKLYRRSELRERAHKRWEGLEGLVAEREQRQQKRLAKDLKAAEDIFK